MPSNPAAVCDRLSTLRPVAAGASALCVLPVPMCLSPYLSFTVSRAQVLLSLWNAKEHQQAIDKLIPIMLLCNLGANEARIREGYLRYRGCGETPKQVVHCLLSLTTIEIRGVAKC